MSTRILVIIPVCRRQLKGWHQEGHPAIKSLPQEKGTMIGACKKLTPAQGKKALKWCDDFNNLNMLPEHFKITKCMYRPATSLQLEPRPKY